MFVPHNHANITYHKDLSPRNQAVAKKCHDDDQPLYYKCKDHWWTQPRAGESWYDSNHTEHATKGPSNSTKLEFLFTGSTMVNISGECNSNNLGLLLNPNGSALQRVWDNGTFASASKLNASITYNLTVAYGGDGILAIVGFVMDEHAQIYNITDRKPDPVGISHNTDISSASTSTPPTSSAPGDSLAHSAAGSTGQTPSNSLSAASPITRGALAGIIAGSAVLIFALITLTWLIRKRILARRAPSYAFRRHGVAEAHWTQRPTSPAVPRSADWETYTIPTTDEVLRSPLLERTPSVSETHSKVGIAM